MSTAFNAQKFVSMYDLPARRTSMVQ